MMVFDVVSSHEVLTLSVLVFGFVHKRIGRALRGAVNIAADFIPGGNTVLRVVDAGAAIVKPGGGGGGSSRDLPVFQRPLLLTGGRFPPPSGGNRFDRAGIPFRSPGSGDPISRARPQTRPVSYDPSGENGAIDLGDPTEAFLSRAAAVDAKTGLPLWGDREIVDRIKCPTGYVAVETSSGSRACMLKGPAIALSKWKQRKKPPISVRDWRAFQRSTSVVNKLESIAKRAVDFKAKKKVTRK